MSDASNSRFFGNIRFSVLDAGRAQPAPSFGTNSTWNEDSAFPHFHSVSTADMLASLPADVTTDELKAHHPAVLERLGRVWDEPRMLRRLVDELMFENQSNAVSFEALVELTALKDHILRDKLGERPSLFDEAMGLV